MAHTREERITNLLSMAQRARRIVSGAFAAEQALKSREAVLVLVAADASDETKKDYATQSFQVTDVQVMHTTSQHLRSQVRDQQLP